MTNTQYGIVLGYDGRNFGQVFRINGGREGAERAVALYREMGHEGVALAVVVRRRGRLVAEVV